MAKKKLGLAFRYAVFKPLTWRSGFLSAVLLSCVAANSRAISQPAPPSLQLPLACIINVDCWIAHYMDDDPSGAAADYLCGHRTYKGHTGVDFAIQDRRVMSKGVPVVASADGTVARVRSDMPDSGVTAATRQSVDTRECGNGVVLQHGDGWETQYCHLKKDSIVVQIGDRVSAGQKLGLIGLSGLTEFPHVHLTVRHTGRNIDPFIGVDRDKACGLGNHPLWRPDVMSALDYQPFAIYHAGFADRAPDATSVRTGLFDSNALRSTAAIIALWVDIFGAAKNDVLSMRITGPDGSILVERRQIMSDDRDAYFAFIGKKHGQRDWPLGNYVGEITLTRPIAVQGGAFEKRVVRKARIE
jgi:hypothetical protein